MSIETTEDCAVALSSEQVKAIVAEYPTCKYLLVIRRTCDGKIFQLDVHEPTFEDALIAAVELIDPSVAGFTQDAFSVVAAWGVDSHGTFRAFVREDSCMLAYATEAL